MDKNSQKYRFILTLADNSLILGQRLAELCGHGPNLETDIALTNISLDLFGQVRAYYQYAATLMPNETEDSIAFLRKENQYLNTILVEQPNVDFAYVIARQYLFDSFQKLQLEQLSLSSDETLKAIAIKSLKETAYHLRFSAAWSKRLGDGTEESHARFAKAIQDLYPYSFEFFMPSAAENTAFQDGYGVDYFHLKERYFSEVNQFLSHECDVDVSKIEPRFAKGKSGQHSENLGYILCELQYMQRTYPQMQW